MKAAVVKAFGRAPVFEEFAEPTIEEGEELVEVRAAGIHPLVKALAAGSHYASAASLPMVPGVDGVGRTAAGERFYFGGLRAPFGTMAERAAATRLRVPVPDALDDARCAAIMNPGLSGWLALKVRARLAPGETVLVLGATGAAGGLAVQIAKRLGAGRVIAAGRDRRALDRLADLGADALVPLAAEPDALRRAFVDAAGAGGIQVIVDYVWGPPAEAAIAAVTKKHEGLVRETHPVRLVEVGEAAGATISLPAAVLRSSALEVLGSGAGSVSIGSMVTEFPAFLAIAPELMLEVEEVPLADVTRAWTAPQGHRRTVLVAS